MQSYFVQLGSTTELAYLELASVFDESKLTKYDNFVMCISEVSFKIESLVERLGGVVKVGRVIETQRDLTTLDEIEDLLAEEILQNKYQKFGVSALGRISDQDYADLVSSVKKKVKKLSHSSIDYVWPKNNERSLNAAQFKHILQPNSGVEFVVYYGGNKVYAGVVTAVQSIDLWSEFDFGRPERRIHEGMLPAKVARMMLNIGVGKRQKFGVDGRKLQILDPFCGSGTVLSESMRMGYDVLGLDNAREAVASAVRNLNWTRSRLLDASKTRESNQGSANDAGLNFEVRCGDAVHVAEILKGYKVDVVVTEPYMGPLFKDYPTEDKARNVAKGLQKLYLGFFKSLAKVLSEDSVVVFALPIIRTNAGHELEVDIIDRLGAFGYTLIEEGVVYSRLNSIVKRKIVVFCYGTRQSSTHSKR